ncbi:hypothetical protein C3L33_14623, partial [Rhododendron williamsianum]
MGDPENNIPPSKKRAAGRELSRDNPGLDDDEDSSELETGTFKKASEEVLANRRIVKVRRNQPSSTPSIPSSNPFAGIRLVPSTNPKVENDKKVLEDVDGKKNKNKESVSENKVDEAGAEPVVCEREPDKVGEEGGKAGLAYEKATEGDKTENEDNKGTEGTTTESKEKTDHGGDDIEKEAEAASLSSFHQLSSTQNAFTGLTGTGFSSSTFSFGSIPKEGSPTGSGSYPTFGLSLPNNGNSSLFGTTGVSLGTKSEGSGIPSMQEVAVETGEENENIVFTADSVLFEFVEGGWKERGKGELKVNVLTNEKGKARLVMRARGNYRLILNASLYPDMKLTNMEKRGITFACMNSAVEGKGDLSTFALKFKDASIVEEFRVAVTEHKGKTATVLKTPENSPKESDD